MATTRWELSIAGAAATGAAAPAAPTALVSMVVTVALVVVLAAATPRAPQPGGESPDRGHDRRSPLVIRPRPATIPPSWCGAPPSRTRRARRPGHPRRPCVGRTAGRRGPHRGWSPVTAARPSSSLARPTRGRSSLLGLIPRLPPPGGRFPIPRRPITMLFAHVLSHALAPAITLATSVKPSLTNPVALVVGPRRHRHGRGHGGRRGELHPTRTGGRRAESAPCSTTTADRAKGPARSQPAGRPVGQPATGRRSSAEDRRRSAGRSGRAPGFTPAWLSPAVRARPRPGRRGLDARPTPSAAPPSWPARRAARLPRYWVAEHHNMPGIASSSPAVLLAHVAAATDDDPGRLRRRDAAQPRPAGGGRAVRHARGAAPGPGRPRHRSGARAPIS